MHKIALFSVASLLVGCAAAPTETEITAKLVGKPRGEVLACMPRLEASAKDGDTEILHFSRVDYALGIRAQCDADVRLKAGQVSEVSVNASAAGMYGVKSNICRELLRKCMSN